MVQSLNYYTGIVFPRFYIQCGVSCFERRTVRQPCPGSFRERLSCYGFLAGGINMVMMALERQGKLPDPPQAGYYVIYHGNARKRSLFGSERTETKR